MTMSGQAGVPGDWFWRVIARASARWRSQGSLPRAGQDNLARRTEPAGSASRLAAARSDPWQALPADALVAGNAAKQFRQLLPLAVAQRRAKHCLVDPAYFLHLGQHVATRRSEIQPVGTPVRRIAPALNEAASFQLVYQEDHLRRVEPDQLADNLLSLSLVRGQPAEHADVPRLHAERGELLGELPGRFHAELHEQERETAALWYRCAGGCIVSHTGILSLETIVFRERSSQAGEQ